MLNLNLNQCQYPPSLHRWLTRFIENIRSCRASIKGPGNVDWKTLFLTVVSFRQHLSHEMKVLILFYLVAYFQVSAWAHIQLHGQPLFTEATSVIFEIATWTSTKPTVCFITNDEISQCRRRRGIQEEPEIIKFRGGFGIAPSAILR